VHDPAPIRGAWSYLARYRGRVALGALCLLVTSACATTIPLLVKGAIDSLQRGDADARHIVAWHAAIIAVLAVTQGAIRIASRLFLFDAGRQGEFVLRNDLLRRLMSLSPSYFRRTATGDLMSRMTVDTVSLRAMWGAGLLNLLNTIFIYGTALAMMVRLSPRLTLYSLSTYPVLIVASRLFARRLFRLSKAAQDQMGLISADVQEDLAGINVIKTYALEDERDARFRALSADYLKINTKLASARGQLLPVLGGLGSLGTIVVLWIGGRMVTEGQLTLGALIAFNVYLAQLVWPTLAIGWIMSMFQRGYAAWARVAKVLAEEPTIVGGTAEPPAGGFRGAVKIDRLSVTLDGRSILHEVSLEIPAGTLCAIVGRTGAGKTTLVEAIPRLLEIPAGAVFLDGVDVTTLPLPALRGAIGYAPQEAFLFSASIADNIDFGRTSPASPTGSTRSSASAASRSRVDSGSAWPSRARSRRSRACSSSTTRSPPSTRTPRS
jgi:ATP-binding cassette subfamily B protein